MSKHIAITDADKEITLQLPKGCFLRPQQLIPTSVTESQYSISFTVAPFYDRQSLPVLPIGYRLEPIYATDPSDHQSMLTPAHSQVIQMNPAMMPALIPHTDVQCAATSTSSTSAEPILPPPVGFGQPIGELETISIAKDASMPSKSSHDVSMPSKSTHDASMKTASSSVKDASMPTASSSSMSYQEATLQAIAEPATTLKPNVVPRPLLASVSTAATSTDSSSITNKPAPKQPRLNESARPPAFAPPADVPTNATVEANPRPMGRGRGFLRNGAPALTSQYSDTEMRNIRQLAQQHPSRYTWHHNLPALPPAPGTAIRRIEAPPAIVQQASTPLIEPPSLPTDIRALQLHQPTMVTALPPDAIPVIPIGEFTTLGPHEDRMAASNRVRTYLHTIQELFPAGIVANLFQLRACLPTYTAPGFIFMRTYLTRKAIAEVTSRAEILDILVRASTIYYEIFRHPISPADVDYAYYQRRHDIVANPDRYRVEALPAVSQRSPEFYINVEITAPINVSPEALPPPSRIRVNTQRLLRRRIENQMYVPITDDHPPAPWGEMPMTFLRFQLGLSNEQRLKYSRHYTLTPSPVSPSAIQAINNQYAAAYYCPFVYPLVDLYHNTNASRPYQKPVQISLLAPVPSNLEVLPNTRIVQTPTGYCMRVIQLENASEYRYYTMNETSHTVGTLPEGMADAPAACQAELMVYLLRRYHRRPLKMFLQQRLRRREIGRDRDLNGRTWSWPFLHREEQYNRIVSRISGWWSKHPRARQHANFPLQLYYYATNDELAWILLKYFLTTMVYFAPRWWREQTLHECFFVARRSPYAPVPVFGLPTTLQSLCLLDGCLIPVIHKRIRIPAEGQGYAVEMAAPIEDYQGISVPWHQGVSLGRAAINCWKDREDMRRMSTPIPVVPAEQPTSSVQSSQSAERTASTASNAPSAATSAATSAETSTSATAPSTSAVSTDPVKVSSQRPYAPRLPQEKTPVPKNQEPAKRNLDMPEPNDDSPTKRMPGPSTIVSPLAIAADQLEIPLSSEAPVVGEQTADEQQAVAHSEVRTTVTTRSRSVDSRQSSTTAMVDARTIITRRSARRLPDDQAQRARLDFHGVTNPSGSTDESAEQPRRRRSKSQQRNNNQQGVLNMQQSSLNQSTMSLATNLSPERSIHGGSTETLVDVEMQDDFESRDLIRPTDSESNIYFSCLVSPKCVPIGERQHYRSRSVLDLLDQDSSADEQANERPLVIDDQQAIGGDFDHNLCNEDRQSGGKYDHHNEVQASAGITHQEAGSPVLSDYCFTLSQASESGQSANSIHQGDDSQSFPTGRDTQSLPQSGDEHSSQSSNEANGQMAGSLNQSQSSSEANGQLASSLNQSQSTEEANGQIPVTPSGSQSSQATLSQVANSEVAMSELSLSPGTIEGLQESPTSQ